jgi:monooxygenase
VQRSVAKMPKQGSKQPWRLYQNYALDIVSLRFGRIDDGVMQYSRSQRPRRSMPCAW